MVNLYKIRVWGALILAGIVPTIGFYIGLVYYDFWLAIVYMLGVALVSTIVAKFMIRNPFSAMLEGGGILIFDINSTGIIRPFIAKIFPPRLHAKYNKKDLVDIYNRKAVFHLTPAIRLKKDAILKDNGGVLIDVDEEEYNRGRYGLMHYPVMVYNSQLGSIITKDWLSGKEVDGMADHTIIYLNEKLKDLTTAVRDFGRHVVELTRPKGQSIFTNWIFWVVLIVVFIVIALLLGPYVLDMMGGLVGGGQQALGGAAPPTGAINPVG